MAIAMVGIEPGDQVLVPAFTFWASAAAVLHHNAIPVFVYIDPNTYCRSATANGCPWTCRFSRDIEYHGEDYPETLRFRDHHSYLPGQYPPNDV
jgi:perosamine synthetase